MRMTQESFVSLGPNGFHRVAYTDWGDPANPHVVLCVHGLSRNSRDFDYLAEALARDCRVVCMDVVGRGDDQRVASFQKSPHEVHLPGVGQQADCGILEDFQIADRLVDL